MARNLQRRSFLNVEREPGAVETEEFMAIAAHDLKNPISVVRASAQMAQRQVTRGDTDGAQARLKAMVEQIDRLNEMLESFLDAARVGAGNMALKRERMDLREVVDVAAEKTRIMLGDHVERSFDIDIPEGCIGFWDRMRISRAVRSLLANAIVFGSPDAPVSVQAVRENNRVRLSISGGGPGPYSEELPQLFVRFFRGRSAAEAGSGSGLGLFNARGIARVHGGDVRHVEGDVFELELPLSDE